MATNNFKAFGIGASANVTSQADYEALAALLTGFQSGKASSAQINKALRQSSTMAYVLAQLISDTINTDVLDNGNPSAILANLKSSLTKLTTGRLLSIQTFTSSGTYTPSPGTTKIKVFVTAAGGSGEFVLNAARGAGGGAGGTAIKLLPITLASYAITVGVGTSTTGGSSSFSTIVSATGGAPGVSGIGGAGGVGSGGDINLNGGYGSDGPGSGFSGGSGDGGASFWGGGYRSANGSGTAFPSAGAFGGGGGGNASASSAVSRAGVSGVVVIEEYM